MGRRNGEPVKHTCPDIDSIIRTMTTIVEQMNNASEEDGVSNLIDNIADWASDLKGIGVGKRCELEDLRTSNGLLRDWGSEMYNEAEKWENEADSLQDKVRELEGKVQDLESDLEAAHEAAAGADL